jgi:hypothetical protein
VKNTVPILCLLALSNLYLFAQSPRIIHTPPKSSIRVAPQPRPAALKVIYNSLKSGTDPYNAAYGWAISLEESVAVPFTPKYDSHISDVELPVTYLAGDNQVNVSIYGGSGGLPGALLAGPFTLTNLPDAGSCCTLFAISFQPLAVSAGSQYWVVVSTPASGPGRNFEGVWDYVAKDIPMAYNFQDRGWTANSADTLPACKVLGTIP